MATIEWWCPVCLEMFQKNSQYFLAEECHCPACGAALNMRVLRQRLGDFIAATGASPSPNWRSPSPQGRDIPLG